MKLGGVTVLECTNLCENILNLAKTGKKPHQVYLKVRVLGGNGSAMRVAPVGAFFADDLKRVSEEAEKSAVITHAHEEARSGAIAVAIATAFAWKFKEENIVQPVRNLLMRFCLFLPSS